MCLSALAHYLPGGLTYRGLEGGIPLKWLLDEAGQGLDALLEDINKDGFAGAVGVVVVHEVGEAMKELLDAVAFGVQGRVQADAGLDEVLGRGADSCKAVELSGEDPVSKHGRKNAMEGGVVDLGRGKILGGWGRRP